MDAERGYRNLHVPLSGIAHNARIKVYPDGSQDVMVCSSPIFGTAGWENSKPRLKSQISDCDDAPHEPGLSDRAMRRARAQVRELAHANSDLGLFVTLTLDQTKVDRYDMTAITKKLNNWLDNRVRRNGLSYVLVPERHKDGAIHFHGLFNGALRAIDSGHTDKNGHRVYNLPQWSLGFTTAIELYGDREKAVSYVTKYIGKQGEKPGGRWYYSGGALQRPETMFCDLDMYEAMAQPGAYCFEVPEAGTKFCVYRTKKGEGVEVIRD